MGRTRVFLSIIPSPFDPRLISKVPMAVARAAMETGVARKAIVDTETYGAQLAARLNPSAGLLQGIFQSVKENPKRVVFAEGEEEDMIRAAVIFYNNKMYLHLCRPIQVNSQI